MRLGPFLQLNRLRVRPLRCNIVFTQMAMAACSLLSSVFFSPGRSFTVSLTALIHLQNFAASFILPTFGKESFPRDWIEAWLRQRPPHNLVSTV